MKYESELAIPLSQSKRQSQQRCGAVVIRKFVILRPLSFKMLFLVSLLTGILVCHAQQSDTSIDLQTGPGHQASRTQTEVSISGDMFLINGRPTYQGRQWNGHKIEGLLMNSRMAQGIFDDMNPETVSRWSYPDTGKWNAKWNTQWS